MDADLAWRYIGRALLMLPAGPLLLAALGLWWRRRRPRLGLALGATGLGLLLALSLPVVADRLQAAVERFPPLDPAEPVAADVIVVLGGGMHRSAAGPGHLELSRVALERLAGAAALARRTGLPLLLSGAGVGDGPSEAEVMQATLTADFGLEARYLETRSRTTRENARASAALLAPLGLRRVALVTSATHMARAVAEFEAAGLAVRPAPVGTSGGAGQGLVAWLPGASALERSQEALHEVAGGVFARLGRHR